MTTVLEKILAVKRREVEAAKARVPLPELQAQAADAPPVRPFVEPLLHADRVGLIAEVKRASPSAGVIRRDFDPVQIALAYQQGGADCLSVLTDREFFQGDLEYLRAIRRRSRLPVLRKDFLIDPYQLYEARAAGADAVLLIAECLSPEELPRLHQLALELGMTPLVEIYEPENLQRVIELGVRLIGINNRNLHTFQTDLKHTLELLPQVPADRVVVSESGIRTAEDLRRLFAAGVRAVLVGEHLMRQADLPQAVRQLLGGESG